MFKKILIANRGEIACRIIKSARRMGIATVAVYSEADRDARHVLMADEAIAIGAAPSRESYLVMDRIIDACTRTGAEAVHPGYGFLSENAQFARRVEEEGIVFIGPRHDSIAAMGDKIASKKLAEAARVNTIPGWNGVIESPDHAVKIAREIGYPVMIKASAGGGGKGLRIAFSDREAADGFESCRNEARASFGDDRVFVEKFIEQPRHIEIQVLGDAHGNVVHLGERECSIQRRHQKLIEEAPAADLPAEIREAMGEAAVRAAKAVGYRSAGTVEFLYHGGEFFFLEMNTRLQVEHPVTELVTGIDLVQWQFRVAAGERLAFGQADVCLSGHAIECRITSEDAAAGFLPSTGVVSHVEVPAGPGVRWDGGVVRGFEVSLHYDPLLAKLIVFAPDREQAVTRMARALDELVIDGVETSAPYLRRVMDEPDFRAGRLSTAYVDEHRELLDGSLPEASLVAAVLAAALLEDEYRDRHRTPRIGDHGQRALPAWRSAGWPWEVDGWTR